MQLRKLLGPETKDIIYKVLNVYSLYICRQEIIARLQNNHTLVSLVTDNLSKYMDDVRRVAQGILI